MSLSLPLSGTELREMFDVKDLAEPHKLPTLIEARLSAKRMLKDKAVRSVNSIVLMADGTVELIRFGKRGGKNKLWSFGKI